MSASLPSEPGAPSDAHLIGEWARLLFGSLLEAGVTDVWASPGSRSTPFTWAAEHTPGITVRSVIDERSAAFLALGHARVTGRPSALLCTSGSAAARVPSASPGNCDRAPVTACSVSKMTSAGSRRAMACEKFTRSSSFQRFVAIDNW